jgi:hypothetical protein
VAQAGEGGARVGFDRLGEKRRKEILNFIF